MRLVDADTLSEEIESLSVHITGLKSGREELNKFQDSYRKLVLRVIDEQPTAYDVDKVVEELNRIPMLMRRITKGKQYLIDKEKTMNIIKRGCVGNERAENDDVCEWIKYDYRTICPRNHDIGNPYWRILDKRWWNR